MKVPRMVFLCMVCFSIGLFSIGPLIQQADKNTCNVYELNLHEYTEIHGQYVLRVPGGWVYGGSVFVPYDNEFQPADSSYIGGYCDDLAQTMD